MHSFESINKNKIEEIVRKSFNNCSIDKMSLNEFENNDIQTDDKTTEEDLIGVRIRKSPFIAATINYTEEKDEKVLIFKRLPPQSFFVKKVLPGLLYIFGIIPGLISIYFQNKRQKKFKNELIDHFSNLLPNPKKEEWLEGTILVLHK